MLSTCQEGVVAGRFAHHTQMLKGNAQSTLDKGYWISGGVMGGVAA